MNFEYFKKIFKSNQPIKKNVDQFSHKLIFIENTNGFNPPINKATYFDFHSQFLNNSFFLNEKNKPILEKIHEDLLYVYNLLKPLEKNNIGFEMFLTGGAVRDFVLNKAESIHDLDITINLTHNYKQFFAPAGYDGRDFIRFTSQTHLISYLLKQQDVSFTRLSDIPKNFQHKDIYGQTHHIIEDIFELNGKNFPIQLFSTRQAKHVIQNFDLDICKVWFNLFSNHTSYENKFFPKKIEEYITRLHYEESFISHVFAGKLSYHNDFKNENQISNEIINHLPKVIRKYPEFSLDIQAKQCENYTFTQDLLNKLNAFNKLDKHLKSIPIPENENKSTKKNKI